MEDNTFVEDQELLDSGKKPCDSQSPIKSDILKFLNEKYKHATKDELIEIIASIIECAIGFKNNLVGDLSRIEQVNNKDLETILNNKINDTTSEF